MAEENKDTQNSKFLSDYFYLYTVPRAQKTEEELLDTKDLIRKLERSQQKLIHSVGAELNSILEITSAVAQSNYQVISASATQGLNSSNAKATFVQSTRTQCF